jgi:hypothetical protein
MTIKIQVEMSDDLERKILADIQHRADLRLVDIATLHRVSCRAVYAVAAKYGITRRRGIGSRAYRLQSSQSSVSGERT